MMGTLRFFIYQLVELNGEDPLAELSALNPLSLQWLPPGRQTFPSCQPSDCLSLPVVMLLFLYSAIPGHNVVRG